MYSSDKFKNIVSQYYVQYRNSYTQKFLHFETKLRMGPSRKKSRTKGNSNNEKEVDSEETKKPTTAKGKPFLVSKLVEFKFEACESTEMMKHYKRISGTMHIPLLQCPITGNFTVPAGKTIIQTTATLENQCRTEKNIVVKGNGEIEAEISAEVPKEQGVGDKNRSYPKTFIKKMHLGLDLNLKMTDNGDHVADYSIEPAKNLPLSYGTKGFSSNEGDKDSKIYTDRLEHWLSCAGGMLHFYSRQCQYSQYASVERVDYKLKIYTVLSAHQRYEGALVAPKGIDLQCLPNWGALEKLVVARTAWTEEWAKRAVKNYILFLELKRDFNDHEECLLFTPPKKVDEVWHAHLSFTDRYQRDIMAFCGCGDGAVKIIEHTPVLGDAAKKRYTMTREALKTRLERIGQSLDNCFWPNPEYCIHDQPAARKYDFEGDSDKNCLERKKRSSSECEGWEYDSDGCGKLKNFMS